MTRYGGLGVLVGLVCQALRGPAWWAVFYQLAIAVVVVWILFDLQPAAKALRHQRVKIIGIVGVGGTLLFVGLFRVLGSGMLGLLLGAVAMWILADMVPERLLDLDSEKSRDFAQNTCLISWLMWLAIGAGLMVIPHIK